MNAFGLSKPHRTALHLSCGNLGQALSLMIKKGIFGHLLWEERGDKRWEETHHKQSSISKPLPQKRSVVGLLCAAIGVRCSNLPVLPLWRMQLLLCLIYTGTETRAVVSSRIEFSVYFTAQSEKRRVKRMASPDKDFAQEILIRTELVALPQILSFID